MPAHVALLRAVNLGGATQVSMAEVRDRVASLGFTEVRSILQSGNLVFRSGVTSSAAVEGRLDREVAPVLGARTEFFVRTAAEWRAAVVGNPFPAQAKADPGHLLLMALKTGPNEAGWRSLARAVVGREQVRGVGRWAYLVYPDGVGRSKLTTALIEKHLGTRGTSRNWNTVLKLDALASG